MLCIRVAQTVDEFERLRPTWEALQRRPGVTLFQSFRWNLLAARHLHAAAPRVVCAVTDGGAAIIPAAFDHAAGTLTFLGDTLFDYRDVLSDDDLALHCAWRALAGMGARLEFSGLRADSPQEGWEPRHEFSRAPGVSRDDIAPEAFAAAHRGLARQARRLGRAGVKLVRHSGAASPLVRWIYQRKAAQLAGRPDNVFAETARIDFMVAAAASEPGCEIYCLCRGAEIVSALLTFRDRAVRRFYTICFDPAWAPYSPGTALVYAVTCESLTEGLECDYMTGEQPHKLRLATRSTPLHRVSLAPAEMHALADALDASARLAA